jgi:hypothetical protein
MLVPIELDGGPGLVAWCGVLNLVAVAPSRAPRVAGEPVVVLLLDPACATEHYRMLVPMHGAARVMAKEGGRVMVG